MPEHVQRALDRAHLGRRRVAPDDRNLRDPHAAFLGEVQHLRVIGEPVGRELRKRVMGDVCPEELEAALRVPDAGQQHGLDQEVEGLAHEHPVDRLGPLNTRSYQRPRTDLTTRSLAQLGPQLVQLLDRRGKVGVRDQDLRASRSGHTLGQCAPLTSVLRKHLEPDCTGAFGGRTHYPARPPGAALVDQDELVRNSIAGQVSLDLFDGARKSLLFVVGRADHAHLRGSCPFHLEAPSYLPPLRTLTAYTGSTAMRRSLQGWRPSRKSHSRPALLIQAGARGTRPVGQSKAPPTPMPTATPPRSFRPSIHSSCSVAPTR